ncbi:hypothetical protein K0U91_04065 [Chryseobacterium chendengshani]|uniref:hypothetical protein n=1 Tax=Chryseobacterium sp. LJ668 TaxID=2864040 RepID=UPI001C68E2E9|nr:hypothetical protein [Chryseobacterium sp. LJ668]MBW8524587.1 hypothetical protein [Chryseobacterium sp. LJ668]QYK17310.1 hypothetical protein K0U91_04065 [Chryseobacterium sp. LJ668]
MNNTNNTAHEDAASVKRVFATNNGDLVILDNNQTNKYYVSPAFASTSIPGGTEGAVSSYSFTLDYPSVMHIDARVGIGVTNDVTTNPVLRNGQARIFGSYYKFTSAPSGVATDVLFGETSIAHSTSSGPNQLLGVFYLEPRKDLYLPKGNYTVVLYAFSTDALMGISVNASLQAAQQMHVSLTPANY